MLPSSAWKGPLALTLAGQGLHALCELGEQVSLRGPARPGGCRALRIHNEFTAVYERDGEWIIACCPEIPGANGQGHSKDEARESLRQAIALIRREEGLRAVPPDAERETVILT
jgi:predicted RNase H-like HicB family nuclease